MVRLGTRQELADTKTQLEQYRSLIERFQNTISAAEKEQAAMPPVVAAPIGTARIATARRRVTVSVKDSLRLMAAHVAILPSQHEFFVEGSDSLLEAACAGRRRLRLATVIAACVR